MSSLVFQVRQYIKYLYKRKDEHALHSPFLFDFYRYATFSRSQWSDERIERLRNALFSNEKEITRVDFGALSGKSKKSKVKTVAKRSLAPIEQNVFFASVIHYTKAKSILEIGTSFGINALYMSKASCGGRVITLEGDPLIAKTARNQFAETKNIELLEGEFSQVLPQAISLLPQLDFVFFDGHHKKEPTWQYFQLCLAKSHESSVFVFHDIYWSKEMHLLWKQVIQSEAVTLSLDFYHFGMVFFRRNQPKQHFCLKF